MREKQTHKIYWAWVEGEIATDEGELEHFLLHDDFHAKVVESGDPRGKEARLLYRVLKREKERTLLEIELITGRYHQIRLQMSAIGHPVCGDAKYGSIPGAIALHHRTLQIPHPISKEWMTFEAPLPNSFNIA
jgi:23S rRNA pseudouridine1911/1915/1917 synthase